MDQHKWVQSKNKTEISTISGKTKIGTVSGKTKIGTISETTIKGNSEYQPFLERERGFSGKSEHRSLLRGVLTILVLFKTDWWVMWTKNSRRHHTPCYESERFLGNPVKDRIYEWKPVASEYTSKSREGNWEQHYKWETSPQRASIIWKNRQGVNLERSCLDKNYLSNHTYI